MRLILVRHGQTQSNVDRLLDTAVPGADLTDLGREQAAALVEALADEAVDAIWVSTLVRTQQTAAPLVGGRGLEPLVRDGLREVSAGDTEMLGDPASVKAYLDVIVAGWGAGDLEPRIPGGESGFEFFDRYDEVLDEVADSGVACAVVVSHGAAIRCWVAARADNLDAEVVGPVPLGNTGIVILDGSPAGGWTAVSWEGRGLDPQVQALVDDGPAGDPVDPPVDPV